MATVSDETTPEPAEPAELELEAAAAASLDQPDASYADEVPTSEPGQPADTGRAPTAAELRRFEKENTRHERELERIVGDDWQHFDPCGACGGVGFLPKAANALPEVVEAKGVERCSDCNGWGRLRYPTLVEGQELQVCPSCAGNGWRREQPRETYPVAAAPVPVANGPTGAPPGYILVKIDQAAPDYPTAAPPAAAVGATVG